MVKTVKQTFFNNKIQEAVLTNKRLWDLMDWVKKQNLSAMKAIKFNGHPCNDLDDL